MATGYGGSRDKNYGSSSSNYRSTNFDDYSSSRSDNYNKHTNKNPYYQQDSTDLDEMTLQVVDDFKRNVQSKIEKGRKMNEPIVELDVANIRRSKCPDECNFDQWKKTLPRDVQDCPDSILLVSMAYGNDPQEIKSILQTKINKTNSNVNSTDPSLNSIIGPLRRLKAELDSNRLPSLFYAVQNIDSRDIDRASRLFLSEVYHSTPNLRDYTFADAQNAVQAIRQTKYESDDPRDLLPIIKTCRELDDIREYLEDKSKSSMKKNESPKKPSRFPSTDRTTSNSITSNPNHNNTDQTSAFHYRPLPDPYQTSSQPSGRSTQPDNRSRDESAQTPPRRNFERQ